MTDALAPTSSAAPARFANVIVSTHDQVMLVLPACGLRDDAHIEIHLKGADGFEVRQGPILAAVIESTPEAAMKALSHASATTLAEVGPTGIERMHRGLSVRWP